jgi:L-rhamnose mutarotase
MSTNGGKTQTGAWLAITGVAMVASSVATLWVQRARQQQTKSPKRVGGAIKLRPEMYERYTQLHDLVWPEVLERLNKSNIRNYVIYYHKETSILFSHFEWIGAWKYPDLGAKQLEQQFQKDMDAISHDAATREWWTYCEPCQEPFAENWPSGQIPPSQQDPSNSPLQGDWWAPLTCVGFNGHWPVEYSDELRDPEYTPQNTYASISTRFNPPSSSNASTTSAVVTQAFKEVDQ